MFICKVENKKDVFELNVNIWYNYTMWIFQMRNNKNTGEIGVWGNLSKENS